MTPSEATGSTIPAASLAQFANAALPSSHVRMMRFDAKQFDPRLFDEAGIPCPESVARSVTRRQAEFYFGRVCAREALRALGLADASVPIGRQREPIWPQGAVGSISHNAVLAAAIVAPAAEYTGIGMDIETVMSPALIESMTTTVVSTAELGLIKSRCGEWSLELLLTAVFSAKESFFKATFPEVGRYFDFDAVRVEAIDMEAGSIRFKQNQALAPTLLPGMEHQVSVHRIDPDTVCTLFARRK